MFKRYDQKQQFLLPLNLEEFVSEGHISRVINVLFVVVDISAIESTYSEEGCPAYHPRLLLKILFYGYLINIRSSRKIEGMTEMILLLCILQPCKNRIFIQFVDSAQLILTLLRRSFHKLSWVVSSNH